MGGGNILRVLKFVIDFKIYEENLWTKQSIGTLATSSMYLDFQRSTEMKLNVQVAY